jgi:hydrogenase expression/formation protein HypC
MCLGVPGQIVEITPDPLGMPMGKVSFGGALREVCFAYVPEAQVGEYVLVHVGFALNTIDEEEAQEVLAILQQMGEPSEPPSEAPPAP